MTQQEMNALTQRLYREAYERERENWLRVAIRHLNEGVGISRIPLLWGK